MRKYAIYSTLLLLLAMATAQPLRLHVLANSDSKYDQSVKLMVRDAILEQASGALDGVDGKNQARVRLQDRAPALLEAANGVLDGKGAGYGAYLQWGWADFPDKVYGERVYPAGRYEALRVVLGDGEGQNWWCVMYPPLCIGDLEKGEKVEFKSAIAELFAPKSDGNDENKEEEKGKL